MKFRKGSFYLVGKDFTSKFNAIIKDEADFVISWLVFNGYSSRECDKTNTRKIEKKSQFTILEQIREGRFIHKTRFDLHCSRRFVQDLGGNEVKCN